MLQVSVTIKADIRHAYSLSAPGRDLARKSTRDALRGLLEERTHLPTLLDDLLSSYKPPLTTEKLYDLIEEGQANVQKLIVMPKHINGVAIDGILHEC